MNPGWRNTNTHICMLQCSIDTFVPVISLRYDHIYVLELNLHIVRKLGGRILFWIQNSLERFQEIPISDSQMELPVPHCLYKRDIWKCSFVAFTFQKKIKKLQLDHHGQNGEKSI